MTKYIFETEYSADSLRWMKKIEATNLNSTSRLNDLDELQNEIIANQDAALAYFFACEFGYKSYRMQKIIIDKKDAKYCYLFAQNIVNADINALQKTVVASKKLKYICKFACFVKGANLKPLEKLILKSKNVKYSHMYIKHIRNANIDKFKHIIISSKKPRYLFELAKHLKDIKDLELVEDLIIQSGSFTYMRLFADKIKRANVEKIEQALLSSNNMDEIKKFAKCVKKSKMKMFVLVM